MASLRSYQVCPLTEVLQASRAGPSKYAQRAKHRRQCSTQYLASWNVRNLFYAEGQLETAKCRDERGEAEDRKVDQELEKYGVVVAETKWFGEGVYRMGRSIMLTSGRPVPGEAQSRKRGEGITLVLTGRCVEGWRKPLEGMELTTSLNHTAV